VAYENWDHLLPIKMLSLLLDGFDFSQGDNFELDRVCSEGSAPT
jgi:hypothetical protein